MHMRMEIYPRTAVERAMKVQEVLLRATAGKIKWWQAAEMIGISERQMRRWKKRYEASGFDGLLDLRCGVPSINALSLRIDGPSRPASNASQARAGISSGPIILS